MWEDGEMEVAAGPRAGGEAGVLPAEHLVLITVPHLSFMLLK